MDKKTQYQALTFMKHLITRPYNEYSRCVSEEEYNKNVEEKKKEIYFLKNKLSIKL